MTFQQNILSSLPPGATSPSKVHVLIINTSAVQEDARHNGIYFNSLCEDGDLCKMMSLRNSSGFLYKKIKTKQKRALP